MRDFVRYFAWVVLGGGVLAAAVAQFAEPFFGELYKVLGIDTSKWVVPLLTFLRSGWGQNVIFASIGFGLGVLTHWVATMLDRTVRQPPLMNNSVVPGKSARGQSPDSTKVQLVDQLYPLLYDLSERDVDQFGNRIGDWRDAFVNDLSKDWFAMFNAELRLLAGRFEEFRPMFSRHAFYEDVHAIDDGIAQRINEIGTAATQVREIAEKLAYKFDSRSVELVGDPMALVLAKVGQLRSYISQECLPALAATRGEALR